MGDLSGAVIAFINEHIHSLDHLEVLMLLMKSPDRWWDNSSVAQNLGIDPTAARAALERLASGNLLEIAITSDVRYRFQPGEPRLREAAEAFSAAYRTDRLAILHLVTGRSERSIRDFANAFRIRRDDDS